MNKVATVARSMENTESRMVSPINCIMSCWRPAPTTFLTPISFALLNDRAVARFMKLKQAMIRTNKAIIDKAFTYVSFPRIALS